MWPPLIDLLWQNEATGQVLIWRMNGATIAGQDPLPSVTDPNWRIAGTGDYDGDGHIDILWYYPPPSPPGDPNLLGSLYMWYLNGVAVQSANPTNPPSEPNTNWRVVGPR